RPVDDLRDLVGRCPVRRFRRLDRAPPRRLVVGLPGALVFTSVRRRAGTGLLVLPAALGDRLRRTFVDGRLAAVGLGGIGRAAGRLGLVVVLALGSRHIGATPPIQKRLGAAREATDEGS